MFACKLGTGVGLALRSNRTPFLFTRIIHQTSPILGITPVKMPSLSPTMTEGTIVKWLKKEGDSIAPGDVLCEIQTDKAVVSLEFDEEGVLAKVLQPENASEVKVGTPIALVVDEGDDWKNVQIPSDLASPAAPTSSIPPANVTSSHPINVSCGTTKALLGPAVRNLLTQYGLEAAQIQTSGARGNLLKGDILRKVKENQIQPIAVDTPVQRVGAIPVKKSKTTPALYIDTEVSNRQKLLAENSLKSKATTPHAYATTECKIDGISRLQNKMKAAGLNTSVNSIVIKSTANTLGKIPNVNTIWEGDAVKQISKVDVSVSVAIGAGLRTPVVTDVASKDILQISEDIDKFITTAEKGESPLVDAIGGTFTITNLGMYGVHQFTNVINQPQCAGLAVGGSFSSIDSTGTLEHRFNLSLSYDARVIREETALKFLAHLKHELETCSETSMGIYDIQNRIDVADLSKFTL